MGRPRKTGLTCDPANPATWLTRGQVAKMLRCSLTSVRDMEGKRLHPVVDSSGVHRFSPLDINRIAPTFQRRADGKNSGDKSLYESVEIPISQGEIQAKVFGMLDTGATRREIVIALHITAEEAQQIWELWRDESFEGADGRRRREEEADRMRREEELADHQRQAETQARLERVKQMLQSPKGGDRK